VATIDISMIIKAVNDASGNLRQVRDDVHGIGVSADETANRLRAIQVVMAGIVVNQAVQLGKAFVEASVAIDTTRTRLAAAIGSLHEADKAIEDVNQKFEGTTANTEALTEAMIKLIQAGMDPAKAKEVAAAIGNLSLNSKNSETAINNMTAALVKMVDKGSAEIRSFVQAFSEVPLAFGLMAGAAKEKFTNQFVADIKSGAYSVDQIMTLLVNGVGNNMEKLAAVQKNTISGAFSLIKNAASDSLRALQDTPINNAIAERFRNVRHSIDDLVEGLKKLEPGSIERFFGALDNGATTVVNLIKGLGPLAGQIAVIGEAALKVLAILPPEALAIGFIAYFFLGRAGAVAVTAATAAITGLLGTIGVDTQAMIDKVNQYLPFGIIGLLVFGPAGALVATGAAAALDFLLTKVGDIGIRWTGVQSKADQAWVDARSKGQTAFDIIGGSITKAYSKADPKPIEDGFEKITVASEAAMAKMEQTLKNATAARNAFVSQSINGIGLETPSGATSAVEAVDKLQSELTKLRGNDAFQSLRNQAAQYDSAVRSAAGNVALNAAMLEKQAKAIKDASAAGGGPQTRQDLSEFNTELGQAEGKAQAVTAQFQKIAAILRGDVSAEKVNDIMRAQGQWTKEAEATLKNVQALIEKYKNGPNDISGLIAKEKELTSELAAQKGQQDEQVSRAQTLGQLLTARLAMEQQALQLRAKQAEIELKINYNNDPVANLIKGTSAGQIMNQVLQQQAQLQQQIISYDLQINSLEQQRINASTEQARIIDQTISKYQSLKASTQSALANLSAEGVATNQLWQSIGNTIENGVVNGLSGLITHTMTLQQVGVQVFNALTQAAVKYLFQLLIIKQMGGLMSGASGFMSGGGLLGGLFANGGVFPGGVKMFANGGIIGGPTLFGMAGEAGTEAIMPLERVGGKLGVRTTGTGGENHIHIHAIDTQSGVEFLMKNTDTIQGLLSQRARLNRGIKRVQL
jgi:hypothetical protein